MVPSESSRLRRLAKDPLSRRPGSLARVGRFVPFHVFHLILVLLLLSLPKLTMTGPGDIGDIGDIVSATSIFYFSIPYPVFTSDLKFAREGG